MLLDGSGSEEFVRFLDAVASGEKEPGDVPAGDREVACSETRPEGPFTAVASRARLWQQRIDGFAAHPPRSLAGPAGRKPQALRYGVTTLDEVQTKTVDGRARQMAGILTPMLFYLAATIRAHAAVFEARSAVPASYVVPVPVNLRPKGDEGGLFRTRVSMLWFQVLPEHTANLEGLVIELKKQRLELIKSDAIANGIAAMDLVRWTPSRLYVAMARRSLRGELASFFFAYTGEFISGLESFMGAPILNGFHTPSVPPSPGSGAIMSIRQGRFNLAHVHQRGVLNEQELDLFRTTLLRDLLGE
jgi:hypothetical protein